MTGRTASREAAVLAIDLGTTDVKVGLVALDGREIVIERQYLGLNQVRLTENHRTRDHIV